MLLLSLVLTLGGLLMVGDGRHVVGGFVACFFGLCSVASLALAVVRGRLELRPEGMRVTHLGRRLPVLQWRYCRDFRAWSPGPGTTLVAFQYDGPEPRWRGRLAAAGRRLSGANAALPDTYGMDPRTLCELLESHRRSAVETEGTSR